MQRSVRDTTLADLVPRYLDAVPIDPYSPTRSQIGYLPDAQRPRLYCTNSDGIDDNGSYEPRGTFGYYAKLDMPFFLDGKPREKSTEQ